MKLIFTECFIAILSCTQKQSAVFCWVFSKADSGISIYVWSKSEVIKHFTNIPGLIDKSGFSKSALTKNVPVAGSVNGEISEIVVSNFFSIDGMDIVVFIPFETEFICDSWSLIEAIQVEMSITVIIFSFFEIYSPFSKYVMPTIPFIGLLIVKSEIIFSISSTFFFAFS